MISIWVDNSVILGKKVKYNESEKKQGSRERQHRGSQMKVRYFSDEKDYKKVQHDSPLYASILGHNCPGLPISTDY